MTECHRPVMLPHNNTRDPSPLLLFESDMNMIHVFRSFRYVYVWSILDEFFSLFLSLFLLSLTPRHVSEGLDRLCTDSSCDVDRELRVVCTKNILWERKLGERWQFYNYTWFIEWIRDRRNRISFDVWELCGWGVIFENIIYWQSNFGWL